jgi:hypothetical protein
MSQVVVKAGIRMRAAGFGRLTTLVFNTKNEIFGLTTNLLCSMNDRVLHVLGQEVGTISESILGGERATPIADALVHFPFSENVEPVGGLGTMSEIASVLSPLEALGRRVQVIRHPHRPTYGTVTGFGHVVRLSNDVDGAEVTFFNALKILPERDGAMFTEGRDAGALFVTSDGEAVGVLIGTAEGAIYAAPLDAYLRSHKLRFPKAGELPATAVTMQKSAPSGFPNHDLLRARFERALRERTNRAQEIGKAFGEELARIQLASHEGFKDLSSIWSAFDVPEGLTAPASMKEVISARRYRLARASILPAWKRSILRLKSVTDDERLPRFNELLGINSGVWKRSFELLDEIQEDVDKANAVNWHGRGAKYPPSLFIAYSGYHEERILADVISMLCVSRETPQLLQKVPSPWAFGRRLHEPARSQLNRLQGGADVRLFNLAAKPAGSEDIIVANRPIFQHYGYNAYCRISWLQQLLRQPGTPQEVKRWIQTDSADPLQAARSESLMIRAWLAAVGGPPNYPNTEFQIILQYLWELAGPAGALPKMPSAEREKQTADEVFQSFVAGQRNVFMGGSIHDVLVEDWIAGGDDIVKLLGPDDFQQLRVSTGGELGLNVLLFSDRVGRRTMLASNLVELYADVWQTLVRQIQDASGRLGALKYLGEVLSPDALGADQWSFAVNSEAIIRLMTMENRKVERNETPARLRVVGG